MSSIANLVGLLKKITFKDFWINLEIKSKSILLLSIMILLINPLAIGFNEYIFTNFFGHDYSSNVKFFSIVINLIISTIVLILILYYVAILPLQKFSRKLNLKQAQIDEINYKLEERVTKTVEFHKRMLPKQILDHAGVSVAACYQPAEDLGGDFYDVIISNNKLIIYLSDVSGHGMEGSLLSTFIKGTINSFVSLRPAELKSTNIMHHLESQYRKECFPDDYFVSIFIAVINLDNYDFNYSGAGFQESVLIAKDNGERVILKSEGLPISNAIPKKLMDFSSESITLTPGCTIMLNTDGLTEQTISDENFANKKNRFFFENSHLLPKEIVQIIKKEFMHFNNGVFRGNDDITFLIIKII